MMKVKEQLQEMKVEEWPGIVTKEQDIGKINRRAERKNRQLDQRAKFKQKIEMFEEKMKPIKEKIKQERDMPKWVTQMEEELEKEIEQTKIIIDSMKEDQENEEEERNEEEVEYREQLKQLEDAYWTKQGMQMKVMEDKMAEQLQLLKEFKNMIKTGIKMEEEEKEKNREVKQERETTMMKIAYIRSDNVGEVQAINKNEGYDYYEPEEEYSRQGIKDEFIMIEQINYGICPTYPRVIVEPVQHGNWKKTVRNVNIAIENRSKQRIPALTYYHKETNTGIYRCSQPIGIGKPKDEGLLNMMASNGKKLLILDCRTTGGAYWNTVKGGWESSTDNIDVEMLDIENIAAARYAYGGKNEHSTFSELAVSTLMSTMYKYNHSKPHIMRQNLLKSILSGANRGVKALKNKRSVLIHCSDGWDRTSQIVSLMQIMLDPYFRTKDGFLALIEKEWFAFGHKFADRLGHSNKKQEESPIFLQFLECVFILLHDTFDHDNTLYYILLKLAKAVSNNQDFFTKSMFNYLHKNISCRTPVSMFYNYEQHRSTEERSLLKKYIETESTKSLISFNENRFPFPIDHFHHCAVDITREAFILKNEFKAFDQRVNSSMDVCLSDKEWQNILKNSCGLRNSSAYVKHVCSGMKASMRRTVWNTKFAGILKTVSFSKAYGILRKVHKRLIQAPLHDAAHEMVMLKLARVQEKVHCFLRKYYKGDNVDTVSRAMVRIIQLIMIERSWHLKPHDISIEERVKTVNDAISIVFMHHPLAIMVHLVYNIFFTLQDARRTFDATNILLFDALYQLYDDHLSIDGNGITQVVYHINKTAREVHKDWGKAESQLHQHGWKSLECTLLSYEDWVKFMDYIIFSGNSGRKQSLFLSLAIKNGLCQSPDTKLSIEGVLEKATEIFDKRNVA